MGSRSIGVDTIEGPQAEKERAWVTIARIITHVLKMALLGNI
jgi:hypothetical protein